MVIPAFSDSFLYYVLHCRIGVGDHYITLHYTFSSSIFYFCFCYLFLMGIICGGWASKNGTNTSNGCDLEGEGLLFIEEESAD
jgi:hypothetical protein